jgi:hypothetical protein
MKRNTKKDWIQRFFIIAVLSLSLGAVAGCYVEVEDGGPVGGVYLADLQVDWRIAGSQSATYCDAYDIDRWVLTVSGPESREVYVDCRAHYWSSENDLLALYEGTYNINVRAVSSTGATVASQSSTVSVYDKGYVDNLTFQFYPVDFGF